MANNEWGSIMIREPNNKSASKLLAENEASNSEANSVYNYEGDLQANIRCKAEYQGLEVPDENIYFYLGHGSTLTNPDHTLKVERVPANCIYITQTVCGIINYMGDEIFQAFSDRKNADLWRDPVNHLNEIKAVFGDLPGVHIHYPKCTFIDTGFQPCSDNGDDGNHRIEYSGLVPLNKAHTISFEDSPREFRMYTSDNFKNGDIRGVSEETVRKMYEYSIYPKLNIKEGVERFLPSKVSSLYLTSENGIVPFTSLINASSKLSKSNSVLDLMKEYPGIHFNFLCRSKKVGESPQRRKEMTMRRRHSAVLQNTILNSIAKLAYTGFQYGVKRGEMSRDEDILEFIQSVGSEIHNEDNVEKFYRVLHELRNFGYDDSYNYLLPIFIEKYLKKYYTLLRGGASLEELKAFIKILDVDILYINQELYTLERDLLDHMATYAFGMGNRPVTRHLCRLGAPINGMQAEYNTIKRFFTAKTLRQKKYILQDCRRAFAKAKTRRNRNNNNSRFGNSNSNNRRSEN